LQSDNSRFSRREDKNRKMATEGHRCGGKKIHQQMSKEEMDLELTEIRARMEELALWMQQNAKPRWVYEWPMRIKSKWPVKKLLARRQRRLLRRWLWYVESLRDEEEMVHIYEPETGRNLSDEEERSSRDLRNCQAGSEVSSDCQVGNRKRSSEDLIDCHEGIEEIPYYQVGKGK
jgi:hypothetical protein